ncbi:outer membrane protein transport protein [Aminobacter anthyllidis]|uniref:Outer membrane protein transport protein n=1 Tax=Aminobacter anthyllidis TaxID=1035067 RepID=A0A9X1A6J7_9HYPH|nr:outer membrane protein transport protein [Aminobacter anthyllidis]MBT1154270.1 outer membrane protein transport protein [Aminobacter anthyllidis]
MNISRLKALLGATALTIVAASAAQAGGFSRGTADTDILYEQGNFNLRTSVTVVSPHREYTVNPYPDGTGYDYADTYVIPSAAVKFKIFDQLSCAGTVSMPYGGGVTYRPGGNGTLLKLEEDFTVMEYGATCAFRYELGKGRISFLGGAFIENVDYNLVGANGARVVDLKDTDIGWRAGIAYEIPEIALRAQLMYRSGTDVGASGTTAITGTPIVLPAAGFAELPQSVELKLQSGIAPGWLAYGSIKWTDWSVNEKLVLVLDNRSPANAAASTRIDTYNWQDGWTVTGGIGHSFSDSVAGTVFATWDRGVSTGWDLHTDTYTVGTGVSLKDKIGGELRAGLGVSYLTAGEETKYGPLNRAVGNDWAFAFSGGYSVKW